VGAGILQMYNGICNMYAFIHTYAF
jgi:hypothetical protein